MLDWICRPHKHLIRPLRKASISARTVSNQPIVDIPPGSNVYAFGSTNPLLRNFMWKVQEGEAWAVVSGIGGGKGAVFKAI